MAQTQQQVDVAAKRKSLIDSGVPSYVLEYAPIVHLSKKDPYGPSSISATLTNTRPQIAFKDVQFPNSPLTLTNLDQLNAVGSKGGSDVYLTSNEDVTKNPQWLNGFKTDVNGLTVGGDEKSSCVIVVDKGNGIVDAFYMYFFAFNWGGVVLEKQLGDHVGDWEHNMIRFDKGVPQAVWYSQHANGEAFKYSALKKDASGKRPLSFCANGSHALFPTAGIHDHTIPNLNLPFKFLLVDETDAGPLYDPIFASYYYTYTPSTSTFTPYNGTDPVAWFAFKGRWGDEQYPDKDKRQLQLLGNRKYVGGPTGPADKQLNRKEIWPQNSFSKNQRLRGNLGL